MQHAKVEICGVNTATLKLLTSERKEELLRKIAQGDATARQEFIEGNLRLVLSVIQRFIGRGEMVDDLFQVGCIGLIKAVDNFDMDYQVKFSTYAVPMIVGELRRHMRDSGSVRVSRSLRDTAYKALAAKEKLTGELSREPRVEEIAKELELKKEDVVLALDAILEPISLFEPIYCDNGDAVFVMDQVADPVNTDENWMEELAIRDSISSLSPREKRILALRFFEGRTQVEVAKEAVEATGADYLHLLPSEDLIGLLLWQVTSVPTTIFVDSEGNMVGMGYLGSRDADSWREIIEEKLAQVQEDAQ